MSLTSSAGYHMKRDLKKLGSDLYDLVVVGGGITGACIARDAALRGLSAAVLEKDDFGGATSAASGKMIHGGLRYLQYGDLKRARESLHERMVFRKIAPQFVHPVPFLVPTEKSLMKSKGMLHLGMRFYELLGIGKNSAGGEPIPGHRVISGKGVGDLLPGMVPEGITGGILYYDCQMHNPERLTLSILMAAVDAGAVAANYVRASGLVYAGSRVAGVEAEDVLTGEQFEVRGRTVVNAAGPWVRGLTRSMGESDPFDALRFSKGIHIVTRQVTGNLALAISSRHRHADAILQRGGRHLFIVPWRGHSLVGTTNVAFEGKPDDKMVSEDDIIGLIDDVNDAYPGAGLRRGDVVYFYGGLYPDDTGKPSRNGYQGDRRDQVFDHEKIDGTRGLVSAVTVKYTTARKSAQTIVDLVCGKLGRGGKKCTTDKAPVYGGGIGRFEDYVASEIRNRRPPLCKETIVALVNDYGKAYRDLVDYNLDDPHWHERLHPDRPVIKAQVVYAVHEEMARTLADVVFRRTGLGTVGDPGDSCLRDIAVIMADELGWGKTRIESEVAEAKDVFIPGATAKMESLCQTT